MITILKINSISRGCILFARSLFPPRYNNRIKLSKPQTDCHLLHPYRLASSVTLASFFARDATYSQAHVPSHVPLCVSAHAVWTYTTRVIYDTPAIVSPHSWPSMGFRCCGTFRIRCRHHWHPFGLRCHSLPSRATLCIPILLSYANDLRTGDHGCRLSPHARRKSSDPHVQPPRNSTLQRSNFRLMEILSFAEESVSLTMYDSLDFQDSSGFRSFRNIIE